ncbi:non-ribosomal peptide synthetase [Porphyromonas pogonae]|uniref:non-ribosomal peptide synthetase n=1 Tax=Porphyromonas pogonae TaxID=867595 RepID=UPI002E77DCDB|nr:non-ribosomal peptide synthetase [Porphyromonas pogonae]
MLINLLHEAAINTPEKGLIVVNHGKQDLFLSYKELYFKSCKIAHVLVRDLNIKPKSKIIVSVDTSADFILLFWASVMARCVPVLMPSVLQKDKKGIACERLKNAFRFLDSAILISSDRELVQEYQNHNKDAFYAGEVINQAEIQNDFLPLYPNDTEEDELVVVQFSSGSTGCPKGVMLSSKNIITNLRMKTMADNIISDDILIHWMPYYHDYGLFGNHLLSVYNCITEIKIEPFTYLRDPLIYLRKITDYKVTICGGTTPSGLEILISKMSRHDGIDYDYDLSTVKTLSIGAEMVPSNLYAGLDPLFRLGLDRAAFRPGYGMAETTLIISTTTPGQGDKTIRINRDLFYKDIIRLASGRESFCEFVSAGQILPGLEMRITDGGTIEQAPMVLGEIQVRGDCVMKGYYNNDVATAEVLHDGWLSTGDLGFLDSDNILYIVGRKKEVIIVNGQNYHPFDLESCILDRFSSHIEKSVFTSFYSQEEKREIVLHFLISSTNLSDVQLAHLADDCNDFLLQKVGFMPEVTMNIKKGDIPKTSSSKIMRRAMAQYFEQGKYTDFIIAQKNKNQNMDYKNLLQGIWNKALEISSEIKLTDNFFALGGDSIRSVVAVSAIEERLDIKLENSFFYKYPLLGSQIEYFEKLFTTDIQSPANEYEMLVREFICEELCIPFEDLNYTESFISKATSFATVHKVMLKITEVFDRIALDDIQDKSTVRDIAGTIKMRYYSDQGQSFPLMDFQETLFYHSKSFIRNEPTGLSCYIICRAHISGRFDVPVLDETLNYLISCHPLLHSVLWEESDNPEMITLPNYPAFKTRYEDISSMSKLQQEYFFKAKDVSTHDYRFDLKKYPLFYCEVYKTREDEYELIIHLDHQIIDGFSFFQFIQELSSVYDLFLKGEKPKSVPEKGLNFSEYVFVERFRRQTKRYQNAMDFALKIFKNLPEKISLPMKQKPSLIGDVHFNTLHTELSPQLMIKVLDIAHNTEGICLNSLLMACYFKLMNLWSGQNDLIINMPVFNREQHLPGARNILGSFLDIFPVRIQTSPQESIIAIARKIETFARVMLEYPISSIDLSRRIAEQEGLKQSSLSAIIFSNSINMLPSGISRSSENFIINAPYVQTGAPGTYIDLVMYTWEEKWCFDWNYVRELFDSEFINQLSDQLTSILNQLVAEDNCQALADRSCADILSNSYKDLLECVNKTHHAYPYRCIHEQIHDIVKLYPHREAVSFGETSLTYKQFWGKANQMARFLRGLGVDSNAKVVLLLNRTIDLPIAQLAIMIAGGAYVPIDPSYPSDRIKYMIDDCGAEILITQGIHVENINKSATSKIKSCILLEQENVTLPDLYVKYTYKDIELCSTDDVDRKGVPEDLIYMIYTSGSTGQPKGTMLRHCNVSNFLNYEKEAFEVNCEKRFALITSYSFDMTVTSNWLPFISGASLHILSDNDTKDIEVLLHFIDDKRINFLNVTPSHFSMLVNTMGFLERPVSLSPVMTVMLGAEIINVPDINRWLEYYPQHRFINEYGPTETTVASTFFPIPIENDGKCHLTTVPIGKPIYNTQVYVLNDDLKCTLPDVPGILYIGGAGVACGYLNKEEKTKSVFIPNPLTGDNNDIVYNTGDLVKMTVTGDIVFVGRKDFQVNVKGYRIELGEIENSMLSVPEITEACADVQYDINKQPVVVAFYVSSTGIDLEDKYIMQIIQAQIPHFMLPSAMMRLQQIPISANGKTDKKLLPHIADLKQNLIKRNVIEPRNHDEETMAHIWKKVLGLPEVSIKDNFWEVGGDSIRSVRLIKELKEAGFTDIKLKDLFEKPTIELLVGNKSEEEVENIVCIKKSDNPYARLICLPYAAGTPGMYNVFAGNFIDGVDLYSAQFPGHGDDRDLKSTVEEVSLLLVSEIEKLRDNVPLFILGYSYSCYIAYDICKILEGKGASLSGVIMIGGTPPTLRDDLMQFFSGDDDNLSDYTAAAVLLNEEVIATLSEDERLEYIHELRVNTKAMVKYEFHNTKLKTPLYSIVGREEEPIIRENQELWKDYFQEIHFNELPGGHVLINKYHAELAQTVIRFTKANV